MQINWFTVMAQIINFLILVWLLKKFLYKPILKAVDDREKKIASQVEDANHLKAEAEKEQEDFAKKNTDFDQQKKELMDKAIADADMQRQKLIDEAKDDASKLSNKLEEALKEKQQMEKIEYAQKIQKQVFSITRKALTEIASLSLEEQSIETFIKRLNLLKGDEKKKFIESFKSNANTILVRSAFDIPINQQNNISNAVEAVLETKTSLQFKTAPNIVSGIELSSNGYKLDWSLSAYLNSLEKNISETMKEKTKGEQEKKATPDNNTEPVKN